MIFLGFGYCICFIFTAVTDTHVKEFSQESLFYSDSKNEIGCVAREAVALVIAPITTSVSLSFVNGGHFLFVYCKRDALRNSLSLKSLPVSRNYIVCFVLYAFTF